MKKIHPDKSRGQNFLIDKNVLKKIIAAAELKPTDTVIEIGAGTGVLTVELAKRASRVVAFEIDKKLIPVLKEKVRGYKNVEIVEGDVLGFSGVPPLGGERALHQRPKGRTPVYKVVANIPYNITSAVLEKFLSAPNKPSPMILLVQKEVAERICAKPGQMSVLSVMVQYYGQPEIVARVPASAFWPRPKVESAILKIIVGATPCGRPQSTGIEFENFFFQVVKAGFSRRRKMLKNNLKEQSAKNNNLTIKQFRLDSRRLDESKIIEILKAVGLPPTVRAQELGVEEWRKLTLAFLGQGR